MAKNEGKKFEEDFKNSVSDDMFLYRLKDAGGWSKSENTRFTISNICDFIGFRNGKLFLIELKSVKGKSVPLGNINIKHLAEMVKKVEGIDCAYSLMFFNFRSVNKTYCLNCRYVLNYILKNERRSIPIAWCEEMGVIIKQELKRTRYKYMLYF